jgi:Gram-negative bacterial TonB protein C-terminal
MRRHSHFRALPALIALAIGSVAATSAVLRAQNKHEFTAPELLTASDIVYPINSGAAGVVIVAVQLDPAGAIQATDVLRDIPSLTAPVLLAIPKWTFKPARLEGKGIGSTIVVSVVFNPSDYRLTGAANPALGKELKTLSPDAHGFLPPKTTASSWAEYPINSVAQGAVVLNVRLSREGRVRNVTPVWGPFLVKTSTEAARGWTFEPATLDRMPVDAHVVIGYVYRPPNIAVPVAPYRPTPP